MNFEAKAYVHDRHFGLVKSWFDARNFPSPDPDYLPKVGCVVYSAGRPVCAGFLFQTDAHIAVMSNLISDSTMDKQDRSNALDYLIFNLKEAAKFKGFKMLTCASNLPLLNERFKKFGFEKTDENVTHFRRFLCHGA
jgi:hypothetical protein